MEILDFSRSLAKIPPLLAETSFFIGSQKLFLQEGVFLLGYPLIQFQGIFARGGIFARISPDAPGGDQPLAALRRDPGGQ